MVEATTNTTEEPQGLSFGGIVPNVENDISSEGELSLNETEENLLSVKSPNTPIVTGDTARRRVDKLSYALGEETPKSVIEDTVTNGQEASLRATEAARRDVKDGELRTQLIKEKTSSGLPSSNKDISDIEALAQFKASNDPNIIFEKAFSERFINSIPNLGDENNIINKTFQVNPDAVVPAADIGEILIQKQEIAKTAKEDIEAIVKDQSFTSKAIDFSKGLVPFYSWYQTYNAIEGTPTGSYLQGSNWSEQIEYLYSLPPSEMHSRLKETLNRLSSGNPELALEFANATISFTTTDNYIHNIGSALDLSTLAPLPKALGSLGRVAINRFSTSFTKDLTKEQIATAYKDAVKANADPTSSIGDIMARMGDTEKSAMANALERSNEILTRNVDKPLSTPEIRRQLPSIFNPQALIADGSNLSAKDTINLVSHLTNNSINVQNRIQELVKVGRLPEEALQVAFSEAEDQLKNRFSHVSDSVVDIIRTRPEETEANVGSVSYLFGRKDGKPFNTPQFAFTWAKGFLKLQDNDINVINQKGVGFFIQVDRHLDETSDAVRNSLISTDNVTPSHFSVVTGFLKSGNTRVSSFQEGNRIAALSSQQGLVESLKDMAKSISSLSKNERKAVERVMEEDRGRLNPNAPEGQENLPGYFLQNTREFQESFQRLNGRVANAKEVQSYFTARQINDIEYMLRNMSLFRDRARQGVETFRLKTTKVDERGLKTFGETSRFLGKYRDELPLASSDSKAVGHVSIYNEGTDPKVIPLAEMGTPERIAFVKELQNNGYKIIQTYNPSRKPGKEVFGEDIPVNFIITKNHVSSALDHTQLPYRQGWHQEYPHQWFVKQPIVRKVERAGEGDVPSVVSHVYEGDTVAMGFHTQAEASKYAKAMEHARQLAFEGKAGNLSDFLEKNLPYTEREFLDLFSGKDAYYSQTEPFKHVFNGSTTTDQFGHEFAQKYQNFNDTIRSPWNLMNQEDKKFVGQRDDLLHTVKEGKGNEGNPVFNLVTANTIDPFSSISKAMTNIVRNRFMLDYRTQSVESWVKEFGHLLNTDSEQDLFNNATHHLYQPTWVQRTPQNKDEWNRAELARRAIIEFLGHQTPDAMDMASFRHKMLDEVYNKFGQDASNYLSPKVLATQTDPLKSMRAFAFHTTIGLFNPFQLFQNMTTMGNAIAIAGPKMGLQGAQAGLLWQYLRLNQHENTVNALAKIASKSGYKEEWFKEAWTEFKKTGRMSIEGEHAWKDDVNDPKFFSGTFGNFLDKGLIFFREGERATRMTAYATAHLEWRTLNPTKAITDEIRRSILNRSDLLTVNMTRASSAAWQQGVFSVPTQFLAYSARLTEQMLGKQLTAGEKARLFLFNSAVFGAPIGGATVIGGFYSPYEDIREAALNRGINVSDTAFEAFNGGVIGLATAAITGRPSTLPQRLGPGGTNYFKDIFSGDKSLIETLLSVSGSKTADALTTSTPLLRSLVSAATFQPEKHPLMLSDIHDILRNVSSIDMATKLYIALNTNNIISKNGIKYGEVNTPEALIYAATGAMPSDLNDSRIMNTMVADRKKSIDQISKVIAKEYKYALQNLVDKDEEGYKSRMNRINSLFVSGDFRDDEKVDALHKAVTDNRSLIERVPFDFAVKHAPPSVATDRYQQWLRSTTKAPK